MDRNTGRVDSGTVLPSLYSIFKGQVASLQTYGAFVRIPGCRKNGLVHKSQISKMKIDNPSEVLSVGDDVYCKVISCGEPGEDKISLSMKVVNQDNGKDLDENLIITKQEEQRRKKGLPPVQNKIELGAILNTVCRKCGMKGHLTQDCFKVPGDKTYDLVPEFDFQPLVEGDAKGKKKKKRKDKQKKKRRTQGSRSDDGESSSEEETKRSSKQGKKKKRKKFESSEDSSESSSGDEDVRSKQRYERDEKKLNKLDRKYEGGESRGTSRSSEHQGKISTISEDNRDGRGKKREHGYQDGDRRWKEKHHKDTSKHPYSSKHESDEHKRRHSKDRYKDSYHHGDKR